MKIRVLPQDLMNKIAAGEVVERPASVVKELVENSIDAGATKISVEIKDGGQALIRVVDNGSGMSPEDATMAFARHATSKIATNDDLFKITTLGFRGEALPSVASIAKVILRTRLPHAVSGAEVKVIGGRLENPKFVGTAAGTVIEVRDLFYNTPARRKYLKSRETETGHILGTVMDLALAHPEISFRMASQGRQTFLLPGKQKLGERIKSLFGAELAEKLLPFRYIGPYLKISGYIGKPAVARASREQQFLFVNRRRVENRLIAKAAFEGYHTRLQKQEYPVYFLFLEMDPSLVDVNVHPQKKEVRFLNQNMVYSAVRDVIQSTLEKTELTPAIDLGGREIARFRAKSFSQAMPGQTPKLQQGLVGRGLRSGTLAAQRFVKELLTETPGEMEKGYRILGQVKQTYIVVEDKEDLKVIDQHAANERELFDKFKIQNLLAQASSKFKRNLKSKTQAQKLLAPVEVELNVREASVLKKYLEVMMDIGFDIDEGKKIGNVARFDVRAVPADLTKIDIRQFLKEVIDDLLTSPQIKKIRDAREKIAATMACRGAVKAGDLLSCAEMEHLVEIVLSGRAKTCPHGRPVMMALTWEEMEQSFGRRK
jgi:DNA mismatch repair protein MutL